MIDLIKEWGFVIFLCLMPIIIGWMLDIPKEEIKNIYIFSGVYALGYFGRDFIDYIRNR